MRFTGNKLSVQVAILVLLGIVLWFAWARSSDGQEARYFAGGGYMYGSTNFRIASGLRFGIEQGPWQASLVTHGESAYDDPNGGRYLIEPNMGACGTWHVARRRLSVGIGACLWEHGDFVVGDEGPVRFDGRTVSLEDDGVQLTAAIALRRTFGARERCYAELFHSSTGGATHYNRGRNLIAAGARF